MPITKQTRLKLFKKCPKTGRVVGLNKPSRLGWIFLPVFGLLASLWFLIRVLPKPTRAGYPCMKVAAPLASTFVVYITGLLLSVFSIVNIKVWFKKSRYLVAGLFVVFLLTGAFMMTVSHSTPGYTITEQDYEANAPMGEAQGIHPGRVTWAHNPDATNENSTMTVNKDGVIDDNDDVYYLAKNNNKAVIDQMVANAILAVTGETDQAAGWDSLFHYHNRKVRGTDVGYTPGEKIFVKTNNQGVGLPHTFNQNLTQRDGDVWGGYPPHMTATSPYAIVAVLDQLVNVAGVSEEDIYVGDPHLCFNNVFFDIMTTYFPNVHYMSVNDGWNIRDCEAYGRTLSLPGTENVIFYSDKGTVLDATADKVWQQLQDADYMINIAALKSHIRGGITLFCKSHFGSHIRSGAEHLHKGLPSPDGNTENAGYGKYRVLVDLMASKYLGGNTMLYVLDGLWGGPPHELDEPRKWDMAPFNGDWTSSIFASQDPVAISSVAFDLLRTEYDVATWGNEAYPNMGGVDDYLQQAADSTNWPEGIVYDPDNTGEPIPSQGVHEHWNNATDMQYSRNLGTGEGIELVHVVTDPAGIEDNTVKQPESLQLAQNYPNPFNPVSRIEYTLPSTEYVELTVYNALGQQVMTLVNQTQAAGMHSVIVNASELSSGIYIYRLQTAHHVLERKMLVVK